jgi:uncharacterized protein (TIGR02145 family)
LKYLKIFINFATYILLTIISMKKISLLLMLFLFVFTIATLNGQGHFDIDFSGANGAIPQTIQVANLTKGTSVTLQGTDILRLNHSPSSLQQVEFTISELSVFPNPMEQNGYLKFTNPSEALVQIHLHSYDGKLVHHNSFALPQGDQLFKISGVPKGVYVISITTAEGVLSGRIRSSMESDTQVSTALVGNIALHHQNNSALVAGRSNAQSNAIVEISYSVGDELRFLGSAAGHVSQTIYASPTESQTVEFFLTQVVEVINPATGMIWMDRNLGAVQAATSSTDADAYGDLYQWGRATDGHEKRTSQTTSTLSSSDTPGHGQFITTSSSSDDWRSSQNDNLWQGVNGINNPCPEGFRIPTSAEWNDEQASWSRPADSSGAFASPLKLPVAGYRNYRSGWLYGVGYNGNYWSGTVNGTAPQLLVFGSGAYTVSGYLAGGNSVRCLKDGAITVFLPIVTTATVTNISSTYASSGGDVTAHGGAAVTARGVCWSTEQNPTINDEISNDGTGSGGFTSSITGLQPSTTYYLRAYATNSAGTAYGTELSFTTPAIFAPSVTTTSISKITNTSAQSGGVVTFDGGAAVTARGVCWSTMPSPTINDSKTTDGAGTGTFTSSITGLKSDTLFYIRSYATNYSGTAYGEEFSFIAGLRLPELTTNPATNNTLTSAFSGGTITHDGGAAITARGVCWSTSKNPTINDNISNDGTGSGGFTSSITGLIFGITYYVRAYATNSVGTAYGSELTITVGTVTSATGRVWMDRNLGASRVATSSTDELGYGDLYQWGRGTDGHEKRTSQTISTLSSSNTPDHDKFITTSSSPNDWRSPQNDTLWQGVNGINNPCPEGFRIPTVAEWNAERASWSSNNSVGAFASPLKLPVAGRRNAFNGSLDYVGSNGCYWSSTVFGSNAQGSYLFAIMLSYYRAYGYSVRCIKPVILPTVTTASVTNISSSSASSGGDVTANGGAAVTARGVAWSTSQNPTINDNISNDGAGTGSFTSWLTGLQPSTTYYLRAYATNSEGTAYGSELSFTTSAASTVSTVTSATGRVWMDRNLGATQVATSSTDADAYGDLYQWGRATDGHEKRNSELTSTLSSSDTPDHGKFITTSSSRDDWRRPQNDNLWQGVNGINNPCPEGFRIPTAAEWNAERASWSSNNSVGAFASPLKLPMAGFRYHSDGLLYYVGSYGSYWSGTVNGTRAQHLYFDSGSAGMFSFYRTDGRSVRCLKDSN